LPLPRRSLALSGAKRWEEGLECVKGVVVVAQDGAAHAAGQAVPPDQGGKSALVPLLGEALQQQLVAQAAGRLDLDQLGDTAEERAGVRGSHGSALPGVRLL
jgi:hypothetical protein